MKAPSKKARSVVMAPMSETAAQLLHQLVQDAADAVAPAPGSITLRPQGPLQHREQFSSDHRLTAYSADGSVHWAKHPTTSMPQWYGREDRRDAEGRRWERTMWGIVDDFGTLVEVPL
jgi:hypothetical protein